MVLRVQYCTNSTKIEYFFKRAAKQVYSNDNYDGGVCGFLIEYLNVYCSIQSNYMDIFAIVISMCLSNRFKQLNLYLEHYKGKVTMIGSLLFICLPLHFISIFHLYTGDEQCILDRAASPFRKSDPIGSQSRPIDFINVLIYLVT